MPSIGLHSARISFGGAGVLGFALGAPPSELHQGQYLEAQTPYARGEPGHVGASLASPNGQFRLEMQPDGNLVIYGPGDAALRAWGARGGRVTFNLQTDGNQVLYQDGRPAWASDVRGHRLVMQDDGNLVLYYDHPGAGAEAVWSSETNGGKVYEPSRGVLPAVTHALTHNPVVSFVAAPINAAAAIAHGDNVLSTLANHFKEQVGNLKDVAPIAQTVISFVPGVGAGVNAAIAAGTALASGQPISEALVAAVKGALPGGPLAARAFDAAYTLAHAAATGGNIGDAAMQAARDQAVTQFGPAAGQAFDTGLAVAHGQNVQEALTSGAVNLAQSQLANIVRAIAPAIPVPALPSSVTSAASAAANAINALPPQVKSVASALLSRQSLRGVPAAEAAKALGTDIATVNQAVAALSAIKPSRPAPDQFARQYAAGSRAQQRALWAQLTPTEQSAVDTILAKQKATPAAPAPETTAPALKSAAVTPTRPVVAARGPAYLPYRRA